MASAMACDMCQSEPGTVMQTNIGNGDVIVIGDSCQLAFYLTVVQTIIDSMPAPAVAEYAAAIKTTLDALTTSLDTAASQVVMDENPVTGDIEPVSIDSEAPADV